MKSQIAKIIDDELFADNPPEETSYEFIDRICYLYLTKIEEEKIYSIPQFAESVIEEIQEEALSIFRTKIYGYYNLTHYRQMLLLRKAS